MIEQLNRLFKKAKMYGFFYNVDKGVEKIKNTKEWKELFHKNLTEEEMKEMLWSLDAVLILEEPWYQKNRKWFDAVYKEMHSDLKKKRRKAFHKIASTYSFVSKFNSEERAS